jgi:restriction endonuclease-like protein
MPRDAAIDWGKVRDNPTYCEGALSYEEGLRIRWQSPNDPESSQVFCISAFGALRSLPDRDRVLDTLLARWLPHLPIESPWKLIPEHSQPGLLGETGQGTPTNVDVFCVSDRAVVCVESKFLHDAARGFGGCGQAKSGDCAGFHGPGSDRKTKTGAHCRLEIQDGRRAPRLYWTHGRKYFRDAVFEEQSEGQKCPFKKSAFQLMRNFLFAATAAGNRKAFAVLAIAPDRTSNLVRDQVAKFQDQVLLPAFRNHVAVGAYDELTVLLASSDSNRGKKLGRFLDERMNTLLNIGNG